MVGLAVWAGHLVSGGTLFLTSLASSAVLIATGPELRPSHPARVILSHSIAMLCGIVLRGVLPPSPFSIAASVTLALCIILLIDALHPPALANAGFAFASHASVAELLVLTAATAATLAICALALSVLAKGLSATRVQ
jgi:hypothetical protein